MIPRREVAFWLFEWLSIDELLQESRFADSTRDSIESILRLSQEMATELFLPHYKDSDRYESRIESGSVRILPAIGVALRRYAEVGMFAASFPVDEGGIGLPQVVCAASFAQFAAANIATSAYAMLTVANARLLMHFGTPEQVATFAAPQVEGRWFGTMCLSETQAGSSLADIRTRAVTDGSDRLGDRYRITGQKMWISAADQDVSENIVHLVLAKVVADQSGLPQGSAGLSLFVVPKLLPDGTANDIQIGGLNHKMGYRGTANCLLDLGAHGGAIGWLVGKAGAGLSQMFMMMNEARINVGLGAAAVGYRAYRQSLCYARERPQGRIFGKRDGAPVAIINHPDVKRMLLAQKAYTEGALALCLYCAMLVDRARDQSTTGLLDLLTPVAKTWSSEYGLAANDMAIQIHGGYGYTRDFDVEQLYRDNRLNPIHEGTTGIQAIDLVNRKILRNGAPGLIELEAVLGSTLAKANRRASLVASSKALVSAWQSIRSAIEVLQSLPRERVLDNATPFLWAFGHAVVAWLWLDQALTAESGLAAKSHDANFYAGKLAACNFFFQFEVPKISAWLTPLIGRSNLLADLQDEMF